MSDARLSGSLGRLADLLRATAADASRVSAIGARYVETLRRGGTLLFAGNGGSAADAQHCAAEYVVRYARTRRALPALALGVDPALVSAAGNDLGFEQVLARQVEALGKPGDLLVLHSTSGRSPNLLLAARAARERGLGTVAFLGKGGGPLRDLVEEALVVASDDTGHIQLVHMAIEHVLVELVESELL
ncbi:MAG TPA: SIS domain-containing protein, partial [Gemmatimonadales bacterium]|nr:SIS domain-containing protein [Gemmatimonadales bacterium]